MAYKIKSSLAIGAVSLAVCAALTLGACNKSAQWQASGSSSQAASAAATVVREETTEAEPTTESVPEVDMTGFEITDYSVSKLNLTCCDSYIESIYPNNAYHPKVVDTGADGWNGYRYWVSYTPYPAGDDRYENPHIVATNDLINYSEIKYDVDELSNHRGGSIFNSDSHLVYNDDEDRLELFWRYTNYGENYMSLKMVYSYDGDSWSEVEDVFETYDRKKYDLVSPAIVYEKGIYRVWYVNGYKVCYREYKDGEWSDQQTTEMSYEDGAYSWHIDVIKNESTGLYEILTCATTDKQDRKHMKLYYATSSNGMSWSTAKAVVSPSGDAYSWDGGGLYRSTMIYSDGMYYVLYSGRNDSGDIGVGLLFGTDMYNLHGTNCDYIYAGTSSALRLRQYLSDSRSA